MAPKRPAPPPPPPPPAASSSEETDSGSSDEESEEEMTHAPPPASKGKAPPPPPPPPQKKKMKPVDVEEEESGDEEDDEEEEDGEAPTVAATATQAPPPPPPPRVEPEEEDEEENEGEEAPRGEPAAANGMANDKKPAGAAQRIWSVQDEVRILEALAAYRQEHGKLPQPSALAAILDGKLKHCIRCPTDLRSKVGSLKRRYVTLARKGKLPSKEQDRTLFELFRAVWGTDHEGQMRELDELCRLYPYFAAEVEAQEALHPGLFKRGLMKVNEKKARTINAKIRKEKVEQIKSEMRRQDLVKVVTKVLTRLVP